MALFIIGSIKNKAFGIKRKITLWNSSGFHFSGYRRMAVTKKIVLFMHLNKQCNNM